ncbi:MAG: GNAT family N-acetyltransferase [Defluviitaleaceae bacterium]|nr:GNAT family N-acetyltransferase [Defluviitaleaceae bacterium]
MLTLQWFFGEKEPLTDAHAIRHAVFIEEQNVPEADEHDGTDGACIHLVAYDGDTPVSTGRIMITGAAEGDDFIIGRVATIKSHRGRGIATGVMQALIDACVSMGGQRQVLHAQTSAQGFYEKLNFTAYGEEFMDAGIPHIAMEHFGTEKKCGKCGTE